jgi:hypothetical protein
MRTGLLAPVVALLAGSGLALGQSPYNPVPGGLPPMPAQPFVMPPALVPAAADAPTPPPPPPALPAADPATPPVIAPADSGPAPSRWWGSAEYLWWWTKDANSPPLVITGPPPVQSPLLTYGPHVPTSPGFIGLFTTGGPTPTPLSVTTANGVLFGNAIDSEDTSGGRFALGYWLDSDRTLGVEGSFFFLGSHQIHFASDGTGFPGLAIPFVNPVTGQETGYPVALTTFTTTGVFINTTPDVFVGLYTQTVLDQFSGIVSVRTTSRLNGTEANLVGRWADSPSFHLEGLAGFRYVDLDEGLDLTSIVTENRTDTVVFAPALGLPTGGIPVFNNVNETVTRFDQFGTHNDFYGGQVGARGRFDWGRFSVSAGAKVALGDMHQEVDVNGNTSFTGTTTVTPVHTILLAGIPLNTATGAPAVVTPVNGQSPGGLFAQPTNFGRHQRDMFAVVPEGNFQLGYRVTDHFRATVGYTFFYMSSVARPGDQIDRAVNANFLMVPPTPGGPARPFDYRIAGTDYWAQGIDVGLEFRY